MKRISIVILAALVIGWTPADFEVPEEFKMHETKVCQFVADSEKGKRYVKTYREFMDKAIASGKWYAYRFHKQRVKDAKQMFGYDYPGMVKPIKVDVNREEWYAEYTFEDMDDLTPAYKFMLTRTTRCLTTDPCNRGDNGYDVLYCMIAFDEIDLWKEEMERVVHATKIERLDHFPDYFHGIWKNYYGLDTDGTKYYAAKWTLKVGNTGGLLIQKYRYKANYRSSKWSYVGKDVMLFKVYPKEGKPYLVVWNGPAGAFYNRLVPVPGGIMDEIYITAPPVPSVTDDVGYNTIRRKMIRY